MSRTRSIVATIFATLLFNACGGGGGGDTSSAEPVATPQDDGSNPFDVVGEPSSPTTDPQPGLEVPTDATEPTESGTEPTPQPESTPQPEPAAENEPVTGQELVGDLGVEPFMSRQSISVNIVGYSLSRSGKPEIRLQLDNESRGSIYSASCSIAALSGNRVLDTARTFFAGLDPISAGESAVDTGTWLDTDGGFSSFERIRVQCDWLDGVGLAAVDITSGPISVDFVGYTSEFGSPAVTLLMTNNGSQTIYSAGCGVEAKRGNLILDTASLFFADLGDIRPGEAAEDTGSWRELSSLDEFDAEPFDIANVNCSYLVRR